MKIDDIWESYERERYALADQQEKRLGSLLIDCIDKALAPLHFTYVHAEVDIFNEDIDIEYYNIKTRCKVIFHTHDEKSFLSIDYESPFQDDMENWFCWKMSDEDEMRAEKLFDDGVMRSTEDLIVKLPQYILEYQQFLEEMMEKCEAWGKTNEKSR